MPSAPAIVRLLLGTAGAATWGAAAGALTLLASGGAGHLERSARLARSGEVGAAAACLGLLAGAAAWALRRRGPRDAAPVAGAALAAGALGALALGVTALALPPDPDAIRVSGDPLRLRLPAAALGALVAAGAAALLARAGPARRAALLGGGGPLLAAVALAAVSVPGVPGAPTTARPDIVLISVDTLRADHLGCYGYPQPTSPALDRLCAQAVVFEQALTPVPETIPAFTSLLTGRTPDQNAVFSNLDRAGAELVTLAEALSGAGYVTAAFLDGVLPGTFSNLDQGFDVVVQRGVVARAPGWSAWEVLSSLEGAARSLLDERLQRDDSVTTRALERWLGALPRRRPLFLHVYFPFPHGPYEPPAAHLRAVPVPSGVDPRFADAVRRYDAEIHFTDAQVARVLEAVDRTRGLDGAWVVFTADHGEELGRVAPETPEGFFGHSFFLYESSLHVPLLVRPPRAASVAARREPRPVSLAAVFATLLQAAGLPVPAEVTPPLPLAPDAAGAPEAVGSVMRKAERHPKVGLPVDRRSVREGPWRLVETRLPVPGTELLHYAHGREQAVPPASRPDVAERLRGTLDALEPRGPEAPGRALEPRERDLLRSLGYVE